MSEGKRITLFGIALVIAEVGLWWWRKDVFVSAYGSMLGILASFRALSWPKASWLGRRHLDYIKDRTGHVEIGKLAKGATVRELEENHAAKQFFAAVVYEENNERLCVDIVEHFTPKIVYYGLAFIGALFLEAPNGATVAASASPDPCAHLITTLKISGLVASALAPVLWDYTRYEKQKYLTKELRATAHPVTQTQPIKAAQSAF
jgi:hypothetical protein